jgi:hypothetical protein
MTKPLLAASLLLLAGCATAPAVNMEEPRRLVGTLDGVRVDAEFVGDEARMGGRIPIRWEISNTRPTSIAVADLIPETSYDADTRTFTVTLGSEVPGMETVPRLVEIPPGGKKSFDGTARILFSAQRNSADPRVNTAAVELRIRLNFLGAIEPFAELIGIKEVAISDARLADRLFPTWLEENEVVYTNSVPLRLLMRQTDPTSDPGPPIGRRRRGAP